MTLSPIQSAFRFHLQSRILRAYGDNRPRAVIAMSKARADVASGKARYPAPMTGHKMRAGDALDKLAKQAPSGDLAHHKDGGLFFL